MQHDQPATLQRDQWLWPLLALAVCLVAISRQSLWIDEAFMASKTAQPTLAGWWHMMPEGKGSDLQMPLYMIYMWGFAKIFGLSEWALRAANIPWFVAGVTAFISVFPRPQKLAAALVTLAAPFAWYYLNEARPYTMQLGTSLLVFAALYRLSQTIITPAQEKRWFTIFCFGLATLCGSSLLGVIWAGAALLSLPCLFTARRMWELVRVNKIIGLLTVVFLAALGSYYVWTLKFGAHDLNADNSGNSALTVIKSAAHFRQGLAGGTDARNLAFLAYELLGLGGLGPGRLQIRETGLSAFKPFVLPLALYALVTGDLLLQALRKCWPLNIKRVALAVMVFLPMVLLLGAGYFLSFRVLGRHFTPVMPVILFWLSLGLAARWAKASGNPAAWWGKRTREPNIQVTQTAREYARPTTSKDIGTAQNLSTASKGIGTSQNNSIAVVILFVGLSVASCLSFRFDAWHEKDDYRDGAAMANAALLRGEQVWWSADAHGATYYHVPLAVTNGAHAASLVQNPTPEMLSHLLPPDVIVASKPDLYDGQGALAEYLRRGGYSKSVTFQAFTIWHKKGTE